MNSGFLDVRVMPSEPPLHSVSQRGSRSPFEMLYFLVLFLMLVSALPHWPPLLERDHICPLIWWLFLTCSLLPLSPPLIVPAGLKIG